jgi:hypothetical protein
MKHRLSAEPPGREFYLRHLLSPADMTQSRLICEWSCFYDAAGKPIVRKAGK